MKAKTLALALGCLLVMASSAVAQGVKIEAKPPAREPKLEVIPPGGHYQQSKPSDHDYYPQGPKVEHDPAFIDGLSGEYEIAGTTGRAGVSGWTSPHTPVGPEVTGRREHNGWFGVGFSMTWGGPPRVARPAK